MCSVYNNHTHHFHLFKHLSFIFALFGDHGFHFLVLLIKNKQTKTKKQKKNWKWTQGPLTRTWEISNLGGKLSGGRRQKRQRPNLGTGRGQESRKVQYGDLSSCMVGHLQGKRELIDAKSSRLWVLASIWKRECQPLCFLQSSPERSGQA